MQKGQYDQAVDALLKAVKYWQQSKNTLSCGSYQQECQRQRAFNIDECILQSTTTLENKPANDEGQPSSASRRTSPSTKRHKPSSQTRQSTTRQCDDGNTNGRHDSSDIVRFIYNRPIQIPKTTTTTTTYYGGQSVPDHNTVSLILLLNLAMSYQSYYEDEHIKFLSRSKPTTTTTTFHHHHHHHHHRQLLVRALGLYEIANEILYNSDKGGSLCSYWSPQATIIISNNVGEIHHSCGDSSKYELCLQHLLSTMMCIVDYNKDSPPMHHHHHHQADTTTSSIQHTNEWNGFVRNVSKLILKDTCAEAA